MIKYRKTEFVALTIKLTQNVMLFLFEATNPELNPYT